MKPGPFRYHDPTTIDELVGLLGSLDEAKLLAGGQSLMPMMNLRLVQPDHLIDLNTVSGLDRLEASESELRIGAMVRQSQLERSRDIATLMPIIASPTIHDGVAQQTTQLIVAPVRATRVAPSNAIATSRYDRPMARKTKVRPWITGRTASDSRANLAWPTKNVTMG